MGDALYGQGRYEDAVDAYLIAVEHSNNAPALSNLGAAFNRLERYDEAETHLRRAIELDSRTMQVHRRLGNALYKQGRYPEAVDAYLIAVEQRPGDAAAYSNLGAALNKLKRYDEAETHLRRAIELNPGYTFRFLAALRAEQQRYDEMLEFLQWPIDIDPDDPEAHLNMGLALSHLGRSDEALRSFDRALSLDPALEDARANREAALEAMKRKVE